MHIMIVKLETQNNYLVKLTGFGSAQKLETQKTLKPITELN